MKKWEYKEEEYKYDYEYIEKLNEIGKDGWEVVSVESYIQKVDDYIYGEREKVKVLFKREVD